MAATAENQEPVAPLPETPVIDVDAALEEYRRREMLAHLVGPLVSLVVHAVLMGSALFLIKGTPQKETAAVEVKMEELQVKELDPKVLQELQKLEDLPQDAVPTVERPDIPQEAAAATEVSTDEFSDQMATTDEAVDLASMLDIKPSQTPLKLSAIYGARVSAGTRQKTLENFGGSVVGESSVLKALRWLKANQKPDGSWSQSQPLAMAGLASLAFLAHGETPLSEEFGVTMQKALQYVANATMSHTDQTAKGGQFPYQNGIATYALSEGYGLTKIPFLKPAMEKGLSLIVRGQQARGGWDYGYNNSKLNAATCQDGHPWDLSVSGWQMQALKAGFVAGADVKGLVEAMEKAVGFLKKTAYKDGKFGYSSPGAGSPGMWGAGTLCLQLLGEGKCVEAKECTKVISETQTVLWIDEKRGEVAGHANPCYNWYYQTQVMFHAGQAYWNKWNDQFSSELTRNQKADGHWECPPGKKSSKDERPEYDNVYTTCLCALMLEVYYRYLPTYKLPKEVAKGRSVLDVEAEKDLGLEIR
jgi:hypothetical protein